MNARRLGVINMANKLSPIQKTLKTFEKWLYLPDPGAVEITLATIAANLLQGDPVWLLLVSASSTGKTELLNSVSQLPNRHSVGGLTNESRD